MGSARMLGSEQLQMGSARDVMFLVVCHPRRRGPTTPYI
jgi:hypothetical protein